MAVVLFHAFPRALPGGFVGVDIFFVISGYLIGSILLIQLNEGRFSFWDFYARRIKRIFPSLLLVLAASYAFGWFNLIDTEYKELGKHIAAGATFVSNFALWREAGYFDISAESKPLLHLWSLAVEEQFYVFWPLMLWAFRRRRIDPLFAIIGVGVISFALNVVLAHTDPTADFYSPFTRFWELMIGCGLAYRHIDKQDISSRNSNFLSVAGAFMIALSLILFQGQQGYPGWEALVPTCGTCLLIAAGPDSVMNRRILSGRFLVWVGLISFPLYLWHWPLLVFSRLQAIEMPFWAVRLLAILAAVLLAWLSYLLVERPIRFGKRNMWKAPMLVVVMILVGLVGFKTYQRDGLSFRMAYMVEQFARNDSNKDLRRLHTCFLEDDDNVDMFVDSCTEPGTKPLVFLWGDSTAGALYPGLRSLRQQYDFRIAEYTAGNCPPLLGANARSAHCAEIHQNILEKIRKERPDLVLLGGSWQGDDAAKIGATVAALRQAGVAKFVIAGPTPYWTEILSKTYWQYWRKYHAVLPEYTRFGLGGGIEDVDERMLAAVTQLNVPYVSIYHALCNQDGCKTRTGAGRGTILISDHIHLTPSGSIALMRDIGPGVLANISPALRKIEPDRGK